MAARWSLALLLAAACGARVVPPSEGARQGLAEEDPSDDLVIEVGEGPLQRASEAWTGPADAVCDPSPAQREAWEARRPKSVIEAQLCRRTSSVAVVFGDGRRGDATLIDLAPAIHAWLVLTVALDDGTHLAWHLENPSGTAQRVGLVPRGLSLARPDGTSTCDLWTESPGPLDAASASRVAYAPVCDGALAVRNSGPGQKTMLERTTDFLRDHVWGGEEVTTAVKLVVVSAQGRATAELGGPTAHVAATRGPAPARVAPEAVGRLLPTMDLGLPVDGSEDGQVAVGEWYPVHAAPGVWASVAQARHVHPDVLARTAAHTDPLDEVEAGAYVYSVAFDLAAFDLGYELGTDHPRLDWSARVPAEVRDRSLPGPDGYDTIEPLRRTGLLDPAYLPNEVALFVGGFKRDHGAFGAGDLATRNDGSHYGFVVYGTELSRLQPGLATVVVDADGTVDLRTWTESDERGLWHVKHARQNGVPLVEADPATGEIRAGALVKRWSAGNWSGSVDRQLRSMRSGLCLQDTSAGRYLVYSVFASATPSAMADVYAGYGCRYALLLDMNALEHTYLSVTAVEDGKVTLHNLVKGMEVLDKPKGGAIYPRFVGYADNRDFFYVLRKPGGAR